MQAQNDYVITLKGNYYITPQNTLIQTDKENRSIRLKTRATEPSGGDVSSCELVTTAWGTSLKVHLSNRSLQGATALGGLVLAFAGPYSKIVQKVCGWTTAITGAGAWKYPNGVTVTIKVPQLSTGPGAGGCYKYHLE